MKAIAIGSGCSSVTQVARSSQEPTAAARSAPRGELPPHGPDEGPSSGGTRQYSAEGTLLGVRGWHIIALFQARWSEGFHHRAQVLVDLLSWDTRVSGSCARGFCQCIVARC
ncbi:hypothetical protein CVIRNUC_002348 [Coccomyxa viridis]|uniref:Uncharacterized protein n=1 Tax=Coccomyxa viridis TaxID=1274662 RepID=A0AAV1HVM9_9CHLO|nr:hypothetical protein CVIRNUC_002348 [Coccomyxa viridis]